MKLTRYAAALGATLGLALAAPALAHPRLVSSNPAASSATGAVRAVTLTFSEGFMPQLSGLEIVMTAMPGMGRQHPAMKVTGVRVAASADHKSIVATLARPLHAGTYDVNWHVVGNDTHRVTGKITFTVR